MRENKKPKESEQDEGGGGCDEVRCLFDGCVARLSTFAYNAIQDNNCEFLQVSTWWIGRVEVLKGSDWGYQFGLSV